MRCAILDSVENLRIEQRLAQTYEHHVLGGFAGLLHEPLEDLVRHVLFRLLVGLAGTHRAVQVALRRRLDDVLHRKRIELRLAPEISPQQPCAIEGTHESFIVAVNPFTASSFSASRPAGARKIPKFQAYP